MFLEHLLKSAPEWLTSIGKNQTTKCQVMISRHLQSGVHTNLAQVKDDTRLFYVAGALSTSGVKRENSEKVGEVVWDWCLESLNIRLRNWAFIQYRCWKVAEDDRHLDPCTARKTVTNKAGKGSRDKPRGAKGQRWGFRQKQNCYLR